MQNLKLAGEDFGSRLFLGTGKFSSNELMGESIVASGSSSFSNDIPSPKC